MIQQKKRVRVGHLYWNQYDIRKYYRKEILASRIPVVGEVVYPTSPCDCSNPYKHTIKEILQVGLSEYKRLLNVNIKWIFEKADAQIVLTGWKDSNGARAEASVAQAISLPQLYNPTEEKIPKFLADVRQGYFFGKTL